MKIGDKVKLMDDVTWHEFTHWSLTLRRPLYILSLDGDTAMIDTSSNATSIVKDSIGTGIYLDDLELYDR